VPAGSACDDAEGSKVSVSSDANPIAASDDRLTVEELSTIHPGALCEVRRFLLLGNSPETAPEAPFLKEAD
jgi:hypothetical protein